MAFKELYDFDLLVNEAESLVFEELGKQLNDDKNSAICKCQDCVLDMASLALNNIKPAYRSSFTGVVYAQRLHDGDFREQVAISVKKSIDKVKKNPSHEVEKHD
jgi:competence protein ComFB